jgi:hypothetical protein
MNVWKYFLKHKNFIAALRAAANDSERAMVYKSEADYLVKQAASSHDEKTEHSGPDLSRAADIYSKSLTTNQATIAPFMNDIIEKLLVDKFSLIKFLITKIDLAGTGDFDEQVAQVEVCVLFIYICELFVSEILRQPTTNDDMETYFISFISERYSSINFECIKSVYELLETNGLFRLLVVVAESVGDMETAIRIDMEIGNYRDIIRRWLSGMVAGRMKFLNV